MVLIIVGGTPANAQLPAQVLWYHTNTPGSPYGQKVNGLHDGVTLYQKICDHGLLQPGQFAYQDNSVMTNWRIDDQGVFTLPRPSSAPGYFGACGTQINSFARPANTYVGAIGGACLFSGVGMVAYGIWPYGGGIDVNVALLGPQTSARDLLVAGYPRAYVTGNAYDSCGYGGAAIFCTYYTGTSAYRQWMTCLPAPSHGDQGLVAHGSELLACQIPRVHVLDRFTGSLDSVFYTHPDSVVLNSKSEVLLDGDTLYWTAIRDTTLHVGKYRLDTGSMMWEQELAGFSDEPLDLHRDAFGRLWTACDTSLIWVDAQTGAYDHAPVSGEIVSFDVLDEQLYVAGVQNGSAFVFKALLMP